MAKKKLVSIQKLLILSVFLILVMGFLFSLLPREFVEGHNRQYESFATSPSYEVPVTNVQSVPKEVPQSEPQKETQAEPAKPLTGKQKELQEAFDNATLLMKNNHYSQSLPYWHHVLRIDPMLPEAHVNLGFVMLELDRPYAAINSFETALKYRPDQANGYFGLAEAYEHLKQYPEAMGAMRTYLHLGNDENYKTKARSAIWEWQEMLKQQQESEKTTEEQAQSQQESG